MESAEFLAFLSFCMTTTPAHDNEGGCRDASQSPISTARMIGLIAEAEATEFSCWLDDYAVFCGQGEFYPGVGFQSAIPSVR